VRNCERYQRGPPGTTAAVADGLGAFRAAAAEARGSVEVAMGEYYAPTGSSRARPPGPGPIAVSNSVRTRGLNRARRPGREPVLFGVCAVVVVAAVTVRLDVTVSVTAAIAVMLWARWRVMSLGVIVVLAVFAGTALARSAVEQRALGEAVLGPHEGWVTVRGDPRDSRAAVRVVLVVDGQRYEVWGRGSAARRDLAGIRAGDRLYLVGERRALAPERAERVAWQHVIGEYRIGEIIDQAPGGGVTRFSAAVRSAIARGADEIPDAQRALFSGLVIGDRRGQSPELTARFRDSGLSHLLVVSGLNVTLLLVGLSPLLMRLAPLCRWVVTVAVLIWFASLTHFEPSIMRASTMAVISVTAFTTGRGRDPMRMLLLAVISLVIIDPLVVRSVGMWLSASATAGVCGIGPALARRCEAALWSRTRRVGMSRLGEESASHRRAVGRVIDALAIAVGAQLGVALPLVATFGSLPIVSIPANLVAVPIASAVKLYGLPAAILTGVMPWLGPVLMWPAALGTRVVDRIAVVAVGLEPAASVRWVMWALIIAGVGWVWWSGRGWRVAATTRGRARSRDGRVSVDR
jgi:competence protein ComEC